MKGLSGLPVLVTGGASGIGRAVCERLAAEGGAIAIVDRNRELAEELARTLTDGGCKALALTADVSEGPQARRAVERAVSELGGLSGLVTSAGVFDADDLQPLGEADPATFARVIGINLTGTFLFARYALPYLLAGTARRGTRGSIVTVASTAGLRGHGFGAGYTASKGGVIALTRLLAFQYGERGIRANCVCPGATNTPMTGGAYDDPELAAQMARGIPLRRVAEPDEIGSLICYLLSDDASYVNGQIIAADGGATVI